MIEARTVAEIRSAVAQARSQGLKVGLVPTMGALHAGHFSLVDAARKDCPFVVVSIFVNPIQFGPKEDFSRYPRPVERDLAGCREHGVAAVFMPEPAEMYPADFATGVSVKKLTEGLCGASRPGHFDGVCTVVAKLLNIVLPDRAYLGAKDYQQVAVIRRMVRDLNMPLEITTCPIVREADGLAMSSRNVYLKPDERRQALALSAALAWADRQVQAGRRSSADLVGGMRDLIRRQAPLATIDYIEVVDPDSLAPVQAVEGPVQVALAVRFPSARLIDNRRIEPDNQSPRPV